MSDEHPAIERLPLATQAKLRSTQILTSLPQIVSELVQNSLDANASSIDVGIDCKEWTCWVRDNGHGINKDGLECLAQGVRYNTSKSYTLDAADSSATFGFRGEALASAADISCLEICSRTSKSRNTWSIILKGSATLYMGPAVRWKRESAGTAVCVRDAFYNLPVRRQAHTSPSRTWDLVRRELEIYALIFPQVHFTLEDTSRTRDSSQPSRIVRISKSASSLESFRRLYGYALTEHVDIIDNKTESGSIQVEGFISLTGASSKIYQFFYINRHPVVDSDFGRVIETQFASSSFGKNALDEEGESNLPRSTIRRSPRKSEKKPVYVLNMSIAPEEVDNCLDPTKKFVQLRNKSSAISLLLSTVRSFLEKNGFLNHHQFSGQLSKSSSPSPRKRKKQRFDDSGYGEQDSMTELSTLSLHDDVQAVTEAPSVDLYTSTDGSSNEVLWVDPSTGERFLVDTRTGNSFRQTGNIAGEHKENGDLGADRVVSSFGVGRRTLMQKSKSLAMTIDHSPQSTLPAWLETALSSNRTYATSENRIPSVKIPPAAYHISSGHDPFQQDGHECHPSKNQLPRPFKQEAFDMGYETSMHRLTKEDIRHAQVISQVDRKFIACRITKQKNEVLIPPHTAGVVETRSDSLLVLIDQHAADERIRVERFLKELCLGFLYSQDRPESNQARGVQTRELNPPRPILLTQHEAHTIKGSQDVRETLQKWGVGFAELSKDMPDTASDFGSSNAYSQLLVSSVPEVVGDKLLQGDELRDFIKGFLGQIQSGELFSDMHLDSLEANQDEFLWLRAMRRCPKGLVDLINSKACRGAIMFNDSLSVPQCEKLVKQLCDTAFPFQCAHGRPSLVPLVEIGTMQSGIQKRNRLRNDWSRLETIADA